MNLDEKIDNYINVISGFLPYPDNHKKEALEELRVDVESAVQDNSSNSLEDVFGSPIEVARNLSKANEWHSNRAGWIVRFFAWIIDLFIKFGLIILLTAGMFLFLLIFFPYEVLVNEFNGFSEETFELTINKFFLLMVVSIVSIAGFILMVAYNVILERYYGATFGKMLFNLSVVDQNGIKIFWRQAIIRNLPKAVFDEFLPIFLPIDFIVGVFMERNDPKKVKKQRSFDVLAETIVIHKRKFE